LITTVLLMVLGFAFFFNYSPVSAAETQDAIDTKTSRMPIDPTIQAKLRSSDSPVIITDKKELEKIAAEQGMEKVPKRIEFEYQSINSPELSSTASPNNTIISPKAAAASGYKITTVDDGFGWYNSSTDLYKMFTIDGPDSFKISESTKKSSTYDGSFGAGISAIEAKVGFSIGVEHTVSWSSTTTIKSGQTCQFKLYTTYHKVWYSVNTDMQCLGTGYAYDPVGTYIQKTFY